MNRVKKLITIKIPLFLKTLTNLYLISETILFRGAEKYYIKIKKESY
jgi:hypothetical protein